MSEIIDIPIFSIGIYFLIMSLACSLIKFSKWRQENTDKIFLEKCYKNVEYYQKRYLLLYLGYTTCYNNQTF